MHPSAMSLSAYLCTEVKDISTPSSGKRAGRTMCVCAHGSDPSRSNRAAYTCVSKCVCRYDCVKGVNNFPRKLGKAFFFCFVELKKVFAFTRRLSLEPGHNNL